MNTGADAVADEELPFVDDYLPALLAQAHFLIAREFHAIVRTRGFTVSEWRVLASLAGSGPVSIGRLAQGPAVSRRDRSAWWFRLRRAMPRTLPRVPWAKRSRGT
jgi:hypothetical protein